jgi:hypothetical protein
MNGCQTSVAGDMLGTFRVFYSSVELEQTNKIYNNNNNNNNNNTIIVK